MSKLAKRKAQVPLKEKEIEPLAHRMAQAYRRALKADAEGHIGGLRHARHNKQQLLNASPASLEWRELSNLEHEEPGAGFEVYERIKQAARNDLETGDRAADVVGSSIMRPWVQARYHALRDSFIEDWKPTGSIETGLLEMMAQLYVAYENWMEISVQRSWIDCDLETFRIQERGKWRTISVNGDAEMQQAAEMADRYNRSFLRTLRQLRDLRRYSMPVTINNAEQVNIAADGGQQVNVQNKGKKKTSARRLKRA